MPNPEFGHLPFLLRPSSSFTSASPKTSGAVGSNFNFSHRLFGNQCAPWSSRRNCCVVQLWDWLLRRYCCRWVPWLPRVCRGVVMERYLSQSAGDHWWCSYVNLSLTHINTKGEFPWEKPDQRFGGTSTWQYEIS